MIICGGTAAFSQAGFVIVEGGIGWIAAVLQFMDHWWEDHHRWMQPKLDEPPSFYFRRQFWATFEDDRAGMLTRDIIGTETSCGVPTIRIRKAFGRSRAAIRPELRGHRRCRHAQDGARQRGSIIRDRLRDPADIEPLEG